MITPLFPRKKAAACRAEKSVFLCSTAPGLLFAPVLLCFCLLLSLTAFAVADDEVPGPAPGTLANLVPVMDHDDYLMLCYGEQLFCVVCNDVSSEDFRTFAAQCAKEGFDRRPQKLENFYAAEDDAGHRLQLIYGEDTLVITARAPREWLRITVSALDAPEPREPELYLDGALLGPIACPADHTYICPVSPGEHDLVLMLSGEPAGEAPILLDTAESLSYSFLLDLQQEQPTLAALDEEEPAPDFSGFVGKPVEEVKAALTELGYTKMLATPVYSADCKTPGLVLEVTAEQPDEPVITYGMFLMEQKTAEQKLKDSLNKPAAEVLPLFEESGYNLSLKQGEKTIQPPVPEDLLLAEGSCNAEERTLTLNFLSADELFRIALEAAFPQETAKRAVVVAMTNSQADDVFKADGSSYNTSKFHKYNDLSGFYLSLVDEGTWTAGNETTWHVDGLTAKMSGTGICLRVSCDVTASKGKYIVSNVDRAIGSGENLDSGNEAVLNTEHLEPAKGTPYLTVAANMVKDDRDAELEAQKNEITMPGSIRSDWVESQFSLWDGSHKVLEGLIKDNLNDERSYKHEETTYLDITSEGLKKQANDLLKECGVQERVELGDLLIITEFSAKNAFDARVKGIALGIASYETDRVTLVAME